MQSLRQTFQKPIGKVRYYTCLLLKPQFISPRPVRKDVQSLCSVGCKRKYFLNVWPTPTMYTLVLGKAKDEQVVMWFAITVIVRWIQGRIFLSLPALLLQILHFFSIKANVTWHLLNVTTTTYMTLSLWRQNYMPYVDIQVPCTWFQKLRKNTLQIRLDVPNFPRRTFINLLWVIPLCGLCYKNTYFLRSRRPLVPTGSSCCCSSTHHVSHLFESMIWFEEQSNANDNMWTVVSPLVRMPNAAYQVAHTLMMLWLKHDIVDYVSEFRCW